MRESLEQRKEYMARRAEALYRWQRSGSPLVIFNGDLSLSSLLKRKYYLQRTVAFDREMVQSLTDQAAHQEMLAQELALGHYSDEQDVLRHALSVLAEQRETIAGVRRGLADIEAGRFESLEVHERNLRELYNLPDSNSE